MRLRAHTHTRDHAYKSIHYLYLFWLNCAASTTEKKRIRTMSIMPLNAFRRRTNDVTIIQQNTGEAKATKKH